MRDSRGFTLIEMLIVVLLIVLISALVIPGVSNYFQVSMNSAVRDIASAVKEASNSTMLTGRVYRIVYDLKKNEYWAESGPPNVVLDTQASKEKAERRKRFSRPADENTAPSSDFSIDKTITRKKVSLPRGVEFEEVLNQQQKEPVKEGSAYTHFFPQGLTEQTIVHLKDSSGHKASLVIAPLAGKTDVYDHYVTMEEAFGKK
jgi:prepilin-type N-terminal cleavage/methylation domain-containing protein